MADETRHHRRFCLVPHLAMAQRADQALPPVRVVGPLPSVPTRIPLAPRTTRAFRKI